MSEIVIPFDFETTGVDYKVDRPVQFSAVAFDPQTNEIYTLMNTLVKPGVPISEGAQETHGIGVEQVALAPSPFLVMLQFRLMLKQLRQSFDDVILAGHNSENLDTRMADSILPGANFKDFAHIDTFFLARRHFPLKQKKLGPLAQDLLGISEQEIEGAHDAAFDCYLVARMLPVFKLKIGSDSYADMAEHASLALPYEVMPFGKHEGKAIEDVPIGYLSFCHRKFEAEGVDRDLQATFKQQLGLR